MNVVILKACAPQLVARGAPQIEPKIPTSDKPVWRLGVSRKLLQQLRANHVAARADARPDGRDEVARAGAVRARERLDGGKRDAGRYPTPAGVHRRNGAGAAIVKK